MKNHLDGNMKKNGLADSEYIRGKRDIMLEMARRFDRCCSRIVILESDLDSARKTKGTGSKIQLLESGVHLDTFGKDEV